MKIPEYHLNRSRLIPTSGKAILGMGLLLSSACAHQYYYTPEIKGKGIKTEGQARSIDYSIPPSSSPELKFRVRALGTEKVKDREMFVVRMAFARPKQASTAKNRAREFMVPSEQTIQLGLEKSTPILPAYIRTKSRKDQVLELTGVQSEAVDLLFPLPKAGEQAGDLEKILFRWNLHYGNGLTEAQTTRFDRYDSAPQQSAEPYPDDPDYPYDVSPIMGPGWEVNPDPFWWPMIW